MSSPPPLRRVFSRLLAWLGLALNSYIMAFEAPVQCAASHDFISFLTLVSTVAGRIRLFLLKSTINEYNCVHTEIDSWSFGRILDVVACGIAAVRFDVIVADYQTFRSARDS